MTMPEQIGVWMLAEVLRGGLLYQQDIASDIARLFGEEFAPSDASGHRTIPREILREFRRVSGDSVIWLGHDAVWRKRQPGDRPGRKQG